jgi:hypothetical protein
MTPLSIRCCGVPTLGTDTFFGIPEQQMVGNTSTSMDIHILQILLNPGNVAMTERKLAGSKTTEPELSN